MMFARLIGILNYVLLLSLIEIMHRFSYDSGIINHSRNDSCFPLFWLYACSTSYLSCLLQTHPLTTYIATKPVALKYVIAHISLILKKFTDSFPTVQSKLFYLGILILLKLCIAFYSSSKMQPNWFNWHFSNHPGVYSHLSPFLLLFFSLPGIPHSYPSAPAKGSWNDLVSENFQESYIQESASMVYCEHTLRCLHDLYVKVD